MRRQKPFIETHVIRIQESYKNRDFSDEEISQIRQRVHAALPSWRKEVMDFAREYSAGLVSQPDTESELSDSQKEKLKKWGEALQPTQDEKLDKLSHIMQKSDVDEEVRLGVFNESEVWAALAATRILRVFVGKYLDYSVGEKTIADGKHAKLDEKEYSETQKKLAGGWMMELTEAYGRAVGKRLMADITHHTDEVIEAVVGKRPERGGRD